MMPAKNDFTSNDVRQRVTDALIKGSSFKNTSEIIGVKIHTVRRIWTKYNDHGTANKDKVGGYKPKKYSTYVRIALY